MVSVKNNKYDPILELASVLSVQNEFDEILRIIATKTGAIFDADFTSIVMINPRTDKTVKTIFRSGKESEQPIHHFVQTNIVGWVNKNKQSFITTDLKNDTRFRKNIFEIAAVKSLMCVRLLSCGVEIGYLLVLNESHNREFDKSHLDFLEKLGVVVAPYLSNVQEITKYFEAVMPEARLLAKYEPFGLLGKSKCFKLLLKTIEAAALCDVRVLLEGESGTGKELIAKAIHKMSDRSSKPFIAVDCGAIPEHLVESELFGHVKGAFTGALYDRKGLFEEADKGTLFMDEISNLSLEMQAKLLRVLQEEEVRIIGSNQVVKTDVRIIAASSPPLRQQVESQKFREDLYFRLNVYPIYVPRLEERRDDIPILADHFLRKFAKGQKKKAEAFHPLVIKYLKNKEWIGNIREMENFIERLVTLAPANVTVIDGKIIPKELAGEFLKLTKAETAESRAGTLDESIEIFEKELIRQVLIENNWNQSKAARSLRISERAIRYKMKKLGIRKPQ